MLLLNAQLRPALEKNRRRSALPGECALEENLVAHAVGKGLKARLKSAR